MKTIDVNECRVLFGKFIKEARQKRGLRQIDMAKQLDVTRTQYSYIENGERKLELATAFKICEVLNVDMKTFIDIYL